MRPVFLHLDETDSSNSHLTRLLGEDEAIEEGFTIWVDSQTAGRGQIGNTWLSEKGENLLFSILLKPRNVKISEQFYISEAVAVALLKTLKTIFPSEDFSLKWPNDIYFKEKKIAGILIENSLMGGEISHAIVGVGLNVNQSSFDDSLPNPISLSLITGEKFDRQSLLNKLVDAILSEVHALYNGDFNQVRCVYMNMLFRKDLFSKYYDSNGEFRAVIKDVEPNGRLHLKLENGEERSYFFKEVEFVL